MGNVSNKDATLALNRVKSTFSTNGYDSSEGLTSVAPQPGIDMGPGKQSKPDLLQGLDGAEASGQPMSEGDAVNNVIANASRPPAPGETPFVDLKDEDLTKVIAYSFGFADVSGEVAREVQSQIALMQDDPEMAPQAMENIRTLYYETKFERTGANVKEVTGELEGFTPQPQGLTVFNAIQNMSIYNEDGVIDRAATASFRNEMMAGAVATKGPISFDDLSSQAGRLGYSFGKVEQDDRSLVFQMEFKDTLKQKLETGSVLSIGHNNRNEIFTRGGFVDSVASRTGAPVEEINKSWDESLARVFVTADGKPDAEKIDRFKNLIEAPSSWNSVQIDAFSDYVVEVKRSMRGLPMKTRPVDRAKRLIDMPEEDLMLLGAAIGNNGKLTPKNMINIAMRVSSGASGLKNFDTPNLQRREEYGEVFYTYGEPGRSDQRIYAPWPDGYELLFETAAPNALRFRSVTRSQDTSQPSAPRGQFTGRHGSWKK